MSELVRRRWNFACSTLAAGAATRKPQRLPPSLCRRRRAGAAGGRRWLYTLTWPTAAAVRRECGEAQERRRVRRLLPRDCNSWTAPPPPDEAPRRRRRRRRRRPRLAGRRSFAAGDAADGRAARDGRAVLGSIFTASAARLDPNFGARLRNGAQPLEGASTARCTIRRDDPSEHCWLSGARHPPGGVVRDVVGVVTRVSNIWLCASTESGGHVVQGTLAPSRAARRPSASSPGRVVVSVCHGSSTVCSTSRYRTRDVESHASPTARGAGDDGRRTTPRPPRLVVGRRRRGRPTRVLGEKVGNASRLPRLLPASHRREGSRSR